METIKITKNCININISQALKIFSLEISILENTD